MTSGSIRGVIVKGIGGFYYVRAGDGTEYTLRARGVFRKRKITPLIGDNVRFTPGEGEEEGWIDEILPRRNELTRPPVANLSRLMIVIAPRPKPDFLLVDALLVTARRQNIEPALVINKSDLDPEWCEKIHNEYAGTGDGIYVTTAKTRQGLDALAAALRKGICCFAGQSGVGKSTIVTAVTGIHLDTGEISRKIDRGKHTTRHAELIIQNDYRVLDTAGFSLMSETDPEEPVILKTYYPEFAPYDSQCRFQPCYHGSEPGCAVLKARDDGLIANERVARYHQLLEKAREEWKGRYE